MEDVFVGSLMSAPVHTVHRDTSLRDAGRLLLDNDVGCTVVVDGDDHPTGILTATDFVRLVAERDAPDPAANVEAVMSTDLVTTTAEASVQSAADLMVESGHYHLPVLDGDVVIGIVTGSDLTAYVSTVQAPSPS